MDIKHLKEFIMLARTGNYLEAADRLFISQSTLSKHIKNIETELNVPLFIRTTRKVELSKYGQLFLPYARQIVKLQKEYTTVLTDNMEDTQKKIVIGSIPALAPYNITDILVTFKRNYPSFSFKIIQTGSDELRDMLRTEKCELAFIREQENVTSEFMRLPYAEDSLAAIFPAHHPFANKKTIELSELQDEEFIMIEKNTLLHDFCVNACVQSGFSPKIAYTDHKIENIIDLVEKGMGIGLLMDKLAAHSYNPNIRIVQTSPPFTSKINICYRKDKELTTAAKLFLKCIKPTRK